MEAASFLDTIKKTAGVDFYTGVPDSQLQAFCDILSEQYGCFDSQAIDDQIGCNMKHVVAANEGAAVGLAAGHYLASGKPALVYMQNSGLGNAVNPICSLLNTKVYRIPVLFVIGWRGEPGEHDEPQHSFQGEITTKLLECLGIPCFILSQKTSIEELTDAMENATHKLQSGFCFAFLVKKGTFSNSHGRNYKNNYSLSREQVVRLVVELSGESDIFVATTGKLSRELYEIRNQRMEDHSHDFLTVGSMGHSSMIALGIAQEKKNRRVFCLDGDGAALMHMGSLAVIGVLKPQNLVHIVINNGAHESVGGMPTVCGLLSLSEIAAACGYWKTFSAFSIGQLSEILGGLDGAAGPILIEVKVNLQTRSNLGRPSETPTENKIAFMDFLGVKA